MAEADLPKIKFEINIEDVTIGYTVDIVKAFGILLTAYFNVPYAERVESSMELMQKLLL